MSCLAQAQNAKRARKRLNQLKLVDGAGSGLDADTVRGVTPAIAGAAANHFFCRTKANSVASRLTPHPPSPHTLSSNSSVTPCGDDDRGNAAEGRIQTRDKSPSDRPVAYALRHWWRERAAAQPDKGRASPSSHEAFCLPEIGRTASGGTQHGRNSNWDFVGVTDTRDPLAGARGISAA
jgi:hypothetical protein